jgi:hypothetical protein
MDQCARDQPGRAEMPELFDRSLRQREYSHEVISAGFWPGNGGYGQAAFYCYAAPVPEGLKQIKLTGQGAFNQELGEFLLNYEDVRRSADPAQTVLDFLKETYSACADAAKWDRENLDRHHVIADAATHFSMPSVGARARA